MRCFLKLFRLVLTLLACALAVAQTPGYPNVGRTPTQDEIRKWDIAVGPAGKELPPGRGTAKEGAPLYAQKCASCHGKTGAEGPASRLVGGQGTLTTVHPVKTIGNYWPFATTLWDYINRAMPLNQEGTLTADEVYALTALLLYENGIIKEDHPMDATTLPKIQMPNRDGFIPPRLEDIHDIQKRPCSLGNCR